ncbi:tetranectin-like [Gigantopelta aegis]|uniref:tetranectin-like n=1 Tax=Gigantopelta aegis TaxID=1735272 RepID=UPI001B88958B|nr:tetranectin-like [Gigantopelta aegis]
MMGFLQLFIVLTSYTVVAKAVHIPIVKDATFDSRCSQLLQQLANGFKPHIQFACECLITDLQQTTTDLNGQISTLQQEASSLTAQMVIAQQNLATAVQQVNAVCPDTSALQASCSNSNYHFEQSADGCTAICFLIGASSVNYAAAEAVCAATGGALITLDNLKKNALMIDTIRTSTLKDRSFWIGLKFVNNNWVWQANGNQVTFTDWANGEPDEPNPGLQQNCGSLNRVQQHRWFDRGCSFTTANVALCEITM